MAEIIKNLIFVPKCKCCGRVADSGNLCVDCSEKLAKCRIKNPSLPLNKKIDLIDRSYASYYYKDRAKQVIKRAKFRNPASFLRSFFDDISIDIKDILAQNNIDMIVPVPCHKSKLYTQEYDIPQQMAQTIASATGVEYSHCVDKIKRTDKQHNLPKDKRKVNLVNAFAVSADVTGRNILLIDDVITTGITMTTLATELKLAGRNKVYAWAYTLNT